MGPPASSAMRAASMLKPVANISGSAIKLPAGGALSHLLGLDDHLVELGLDRFTVTDQCPTHGFQFGQQCVNVFLLDHDVISVCDALQPGLPP